MTPPLGQQTSEKALPAKVTAAQKALTAASAGLPCWYALRVFGNRIQSIKENLQKEGAQTYQAIKTTTQTVNGRSVIRQTQLAPGLLFVRWDLDRLKAYKREHINELMIYSKADSPEPAPIDERQMELFILVTSADPSADIRTLDPARLSDPVLFRTGDRVRVTEGPFKGTEGIIKRIKKDRKLLVAIQGVVVIAISNIPFQFLEKIPTPAATEGTTQAMNN